MPVSSSALLNSALMRSRSDSPAVGRQQVVVVEADAVGARARPACARSAPGPAPGRVSTPKGSLPLWPTVQSPNVNLCSRRGREIRSAGALLRRGQWTSSRLAISWTAQQTSARGGRESIGGGCRLLHAGHQGAGGRPRGRPRGGVRAGRPRGHRQRRRARDRPPGLVGRAARGARRDRPRRRSSPRSRWPASSTGWWCATPTAGRCARPCSGTTPARRAEAHELRERARRAMPGPSAWAWCPCPRSPSRAGPGCAPTSPTWRRPRGRCGCRTTGSPSA